VAEESHARQTRYEALMDAGNRAKAALNTDQAQVLGQAVISQELGVLNQNIELLIQELRFLRARMP
jgi:hypothetical protein